MEVFSSSNDCSLVFDKEMAYFGVVLFGVFGVLVQWCSGVVIVIKKISNFLCYFQHFLHL